MTRKEFSGVMAWLALAIGKPISSEPAEALARMQVYYGMLGDLPLHVLEKAAQCVVLSHPWATFPSIAELHKRLPTPLKGQSRH